MIPWLSPGSDFPPLEEALDDPHGLIAAGNDLAPDTLIRAYSQGIFPWYDANQPILWWAPNPRCVFRPGDFHISRRLARYLRNTDLTFYLDQDFEQVIDTCAAPRNHDEGTWITPEMRAAYVRLHDMGYAHCATVFEKGVLAGGFYGVQLGGVLFGESMFSTRDNGSKSVLALLWRLAPRLGIRLLDAQLESAHLMRLGAFLMPRMEFRQELERLITDTTPRSWPKNRFYWNSLTP